MSRPFRRKVLYIPGFDPIPPRRYRELFRKESPVQAAISDYRMELVRPLHKAAFGWQTRGSFPEGEAETQFEVLVWADLVQDSMRRGIAGTYMQLFSTAWAYIGTGALFQLMKLRRGPVLAALYPIVVLLLQALVGLILAGLAGWILTKLTLWWIGLPVALAVFWGMLSGFRRIDNRLFAYYLMHDYAFTAQHRGAYPAELEQRLAQFGDRVSQALSEDVDEVLVVGHSSGAYLAVSLLADLLRAKPLPEKGPALALLSLGHVVPMASFLPKADRLREDLAFLSENETIFWLDVTAPGDACCFGLCDPVAVSGMAGPDQRWPLVISAAFRQTLSPEMQKSLRWRWFRLHFQYLCAFDRPGDYDYFAITAGPLKLSKRFADRHPSPARITRPVGPGRRT
ncbi:hypothetical protein [Paracoccus onubensis]|uniref:Alpha/beta hydrolase n=1 Tax=Paracoccus onubensis TaxID=1675788 RepID=A0A418SX03_9RHOB|nr:hypothetical protein [Paracoccus onubensis]RJE85494.1 hypothetical protein D3P04_10050 [Paracoccus onubensis]